MDDDENIFEAKVSIAGEPVLIRTHKCPDADESAGIIMLEEAGTKEFLDEYAPNRIIYLGIGGGHFDEHNQEGEVKKKDKECASSLLAKVLNIENFLRWKKILRFIHLNDTDGRKNPRDIAELLKIMHLQDPLHQYENVDWFLKGLLVKYLFDYQNGDFTIDRIAEIQAKNKKKRKIIDENEWKHKGEACLWAHQRMFEFAVNEIKSRAKKGKIKVDVFDGFKLTIFDKARNYRSSAALKAKTGFNADIALVRSDDGHIVISKNKRRVKRKIEEALAVLRVMEQRKKVELNLLAYPITTDWRDLRSDGTVVGAEEWFGHFDLQMVFNKTIKHPNVPETSLSLEEITQAIRIGFGNSLYYQKCSEKICYFGKKCPWFDFGLPRCRQIRRQQYEKKATISAAI